MRRVEDSRVLMDFAAFALFCGGIIQLTPDIFIASVIDRGYLFGVFARSLESFYQSSMLSAVFAVPFHATWTAIAYRGQARRQYVLFTQRAQVAFTSFGFLGTIMGVSLAIGGLETAMGEGDTSSLVEGLSTAFDTTFLGLLGALLLMALQWVGASGVDS